MNSNRAKSKQLGMDVGTATHRLKLSILFSLVQQTGQDTCYQCGKPITEAQELSIEHKQPWYKVDTGLFWDLGNVAFSHRLCNRPDRPT